MNGPADLLLLNVSNYPGLPIYPYAFIQVSAVARRHGMTVHRLDLSGMDRRHWPNLLRTTLASVAPRIIGVHLRQVDSLNSWDYDTRPAGHAAGSVDLNPEDRDKRPTQIRTDYFPANETRDLISTLRTLTGVPVVVGGFGFTTHSRRLAEFLAPDFGIQGEPDDFFAKLDDVLDGRALDTVDNLIYRHDGSYAVNRRVFYGPPQHSEYDDAILGDVHRFYGSPGIFAPDGPHLPVEVLRGCPCRCYFCTEPSVKGTGRSYRDLDVVMAEIEFLASRNVPRIWLVCSEINVGSNRLLLQLGARMHELNSQRPDAPVIWSAYLLPAPPLDRTEMRLLLEAGFRPGWNQVMSFDDANLKATKVPYRTTHALQALVDWQDEGKAFQDAGNFSVDVPGWRPLRGHGHRLDLFLGNSYADAKTVSTTLHVVNSTGLARRYDGAQITNATRIFEKDSGQITGTADSVYSVGPQGVLPGRDLLYPTFHYADDLVERLGGRSAVDDFFAYVEDSLLSSGHLALKDWTGFVVRTVTRDRLSVWCGSRAEDLVRDLFSPAHRPTAGSRAATQSLVEWLVDRQRPAAVLLFEYLGLRIEKDGSLPGTGYELLRHLFYRFGEEADLLTAVEAELGWASDSPEMFVLKYYLYRYDLRLRRDYCDIIFHDLLTVGEGVTA
jgi:hypothetical protein